MSTLSGEQVAYYAWKHGFRSDQLTIAVAVARAESGWRTDARLLTSQEDSRGLWQINTFAHRNFNLGLLYDPNYNAYAASVVYVNAGRRWTPWTTYTRGTYRQFMSAAATAVRQLASMGYNPGVSEQFGPASAPGTPPTVQEQFGAAYDYTPDLHDQQHSLYNLSGAFLNGANSIYSLTVTETFGHG